MEERDGFSFLALGWAYDGNHSFPSLVKSLFTTRTIDWRVIGVKEAADSGVCVSCQLLVAQQQVVLPER